MKRTYTTPESIEVIELPLEVWGEIFSYLTCFRLFRVASPVCKAWQADDFLYKCVREMKRYQMMYTDDTRLGKLCNVTKLEVSWYLLKYDITDASLEKLGANLKKLTLFAVKNITSMSLSQLTNLTSLSLKHLGEPLQNDSLCYLTKLERLSLIGVNMARELTDGAFTALTNLKTLFLPECRSLTDRCLHSLGRLKRLNISTNNTITGEGLLPLSRLKYLVLGGYMKNIPLYVYQELGSRLKTLTIKGPLGGVNAANLPLLTRLTTLHTPGFSQLDDSNLKRMTGLTSLSFGKANQLITPDAVISLTNLRHLCIAGNRCITNETIALMPHLESLSLRLPSSHIDIEKLPSTLYVIEDAD